LTGLLRFELSDVVFESGEAERMERKREVGKKSRR
jgi:hypothetical protein